MKNKDWMIYGAYGYTGRLITEEAKKRNLKPVLAGRSIHKLKKFAEDMNLEYIPFDLNDSKELFHIISEFKAILNSAGPFIYTSAPLVQTCLQAGTNYLDITGEVPVFEQNFKYHEQALESGIAVISGVGFDVIPTDCMAKHVNKKISNANELEIAIAGEGGISPGTLKTMVEHLPTGILIRRNGQLVKFSQEKNTREIRFLDKIRTVIPVTWGDLATAYRTTGIPNITVYMPYSNTMRNLIKSVSIKNRKEIYAWIEKNVEGPDEQTRQNAHSYIWACVSNQKGEISQAWLETLEGYRFTAIASVLCIDKIFQNQPKGCLTPALAFGEDFVLEIPGTKRLDEL